MSLHNFETVARNIALTYHSIPDNSYYLCKLLSSLLSYSHDEHTQKLGIHPCLSIILFKLAISVHKAAVYGKTYHWNCDFCYQWDQKTQRKHKSTRRNHLWIQGSQPMTSVHAFLPYRELSASKRQDYFQYHSKSAVKVDNLTSLSDRLH